MKKNPLRGIRERCRLTLEDVAEMMLVTPNTVGNWERTGHFKHPEDLHDLLDLYQVDYPERCRVVQLIFGRPEEQV